MATSPEQMENEPEKMENEPEQMENGLQICNGIMAFQNLNVNEKELMEKEEELKHIQRTIASLKIQQSKWITLIARNFSTILLDGSGSITSDELAAFNRVMSLDENLHTTTILPAEIILFLNIYIAKEAKSLNLNLSSFGVSFVQVEKCPFCAPAPVCLADCCSSAGLTAQKVMQIVGAVRPAQAGFKPDELVWITVYKKLLDTCRTPRDAAKFAGIDLSIFTEDKRKRIEYLGMGSIYTFFSKDKYVRICLLKKFGKKSIICLPFEKPSEVSP